MRTILITGANRGLGLALTTILLYRGETIIAACRSPQSADGLLDLAKHYPDTLQTLALDVTETASIHSAASVLASKSMYPDILINNAAILIGDNALTMTQETMLASYKTNTIGPVLVMQQLLPLLLKSKHPAIVNISSEAGSLSRYENSASICSYACTKSALNMAIRCMAKELKSHSIPVVAVHPGWVQTDMGGKGADLTPETSAHAIIDNIVDKISMAMSGEFFLFDGTACPW